PGQRPECARRWLVERLERSAAPGAVVDAAAPPELGQPVAVEAARPVQVARAVVLLRPLALEHGLGPTVLKLLPPIRADGIAAVMPDHRRVSEAEARAGRLEPP